MRVRRHDLHGADPARQTRGDASTSYRKRAVAPMQDAEGMTMQATCEYIERNVPNGRGIPRVLSPADVRMIRRIGAERDAAIKRIEEAVEELRFARMALREIPNKAEIARDLGVSDSAVAEAEQRRSYKWVKL